MCYQSVKLMETSLNDEHEQHHQQHRSTTELAASNSRSSEELSPVAAVVQVVQAGRRAFEPQRVINDYNDTIILRFAQPSNAFIKTYSKCKSPLPASRHDPVRNPPLRNRHTFPNPVFSGIKAPSHPLVASTQHRADRFCFA